MNGAHMDDPDQEGPFRLEWSREGHAAHSALTTVVH